MLPTDGGSEHATEAFIGPKRVFLVVLYLFIFGKNKTGRKNKLHMLHQQACHCRVTHGTRAWNAHIGWICRCFASTVKVVWGSTYGTPCSEAEATLNRDRSHSEHKTARARFTPCLL